MLRTPCEGGRRLFPKNKNKRIRYLVPETVFKRSQNKKLGTIVRNRLQMFFKRRPEYKKFCRSDRADPVGARAFLRGTSAVKLVMRVHAAHGL